MNSPLIRIIPLLLAVAAMLASCSPAAPPRRTIERAAVESVADEFAVGPFRFHLPPGFRSVADARLEDLQAALDGLNTGIPDALGVFAPLRSAGETVRLFESEQNRYRLLFRTGPVTKGMDQAEIQGEHKVWWTMGLEEGRFLPSDRVAQIVELAGQQMVHTTLRSARNPGGVRVWDAILAGRRHTIAILFAQQEDDNGGRIEGFLHSIRVEPGLAGI